MTSLGIFEARASVSPTTSKPASQAFVMPDPLAYKQSTAASCQIRHAMSGALQLQSTPPAMDSEDPIQQT